MTRVRVPKGSDDPFRGVKWQVKEKLRRNKLKREQSEREQATGGRTVTSEVVIEPTESNFFECEPDTYYDAILRVIESIPNKFPESRHDTQLQWDFEVAGCENEDGTQAFKRAWSSPVWNPRSKTFKWAKAILGEVDKDMPLRTSTLIDKPCRIVMVTGVDDKGNDTLALNVVAALKAATPAAAKSKPGLAARLKADPPAGVEVADVCQGAGCESLDITYTSKGTPYCDQHMP